MKQKVDFKVIIVILFASSILGILFNFFYSKGISLIRKEKVIAWAKDSIVNGNVESEIKDKIISGVKKKENIQSKQLSDGKNKDNQILLKPAFIYLKQASTLFKSKKAIFIDARDKWDFADGHIPNALNIPEYSFDNSNPILQTIPLDKTIVTYCGGDDCDISSKLAENLFGLGYKKVFIFFGGWNEWIKAGYPSEVK
ncbi:MAG: rhodanese-like domain-containing protein [Ignavibacteriales bacterium]|nr:rhodanese-like domain-containing protein [Ignavibacteriales bacterium]